MDFQFDLMFGSDMITGCRVREQDRKKGNIDNQLKNEICSHDYCSVCVCVSMRGIFRGSMAQTKFIC